jgi:hypothetical protein
MQMGILDTIVVATRNLIVRLKNQLFVLLTLPGPSSILEQSPFMISWHLDVFTTKCYRIAVFVVKGGDCKNSVAVT